MTISWPSAKRVAWTAVLLAGVAGIYFYLRQANLDSAFPVVLAIIVVITVLLGNFLSLGVRIKSGRRTITLPWYVLRRAIDIALIATVVAGFVATTGSPVQHSESIGMLPFAGRQLQVAGTVDLPAGDIAVWYAVHCGDCGEIDNDRSDPTRYPAHTQVAASGPGTVTALPILHTRYTVSSDQFGVREEKEIGLLHIAAAGAYVVRVQVSSSDYPDPRVFLGTRQPALLDPVRLNVLAALIALSLLVSLRPRRKPAPEQA